MLSGIVGIMTYEFSVFKAFFCLVEVGGEESFQKVGKDKEKITLSFTTQK